MGFPRELFDDTNYIITQAELHEFQIKKLFKWLFLFHIYQGLISVVLYLFQIQYILLIWILNSSSLHFYTFYNYQKSNSILIEAVLEILKIICYAFIIKKVIQISLTKSLIDINSNKNLKEMILKSIICSFSNLPLAVRLIFYCPIWRTKDLVVFEVNSVVIVLILNILKKNLQRAGWLKCKYIILMIQLISSIYILVKILKKFGKLIKWKTQKNKSKIKYLKELNYKKID